MWTKLDFIIGVHSIYQFTSRRHINYLQLGCWQLDNDWKIARETLACLLLYPENRQIKIRYQVKKRKGEYSIHHWPKLLSLICYINNLYFFKKSLPTKFNFLRANVPAVISASRHVKMAHLPLFTVHGRAVPPRWPGRLWRHTSALWRMGDIIGK
jgi:hypothetical protein